MKSSNHISFQNLFHICWYHNVPINFIKGHTLKQSQLLMWGCIHMMSSSLMSCLFCKLSRRSCCQHGNMFCSMIVKKFSTPEWVALSTSLEFVSKSFQMKQLVVEATSALSTSLRASGPWKPLLLSIALLHLLFGQGHYLQIHLKSIDVKQLLIIIYAIHDSHLLDCFAHIKKPQPWSWSCFD